MLFYYIFIFYIILDIKMIQSGLQIQLETQPCRLLL